MDLTNIHKKLTLIEYPGNVQNDDKMIATLGGIRRLSEIFSQDKRRLELKFRPDDIFCKPTIGVQHSTAGILLKVKVKRKKGDISAGNDNKIINVDVLGQVNSSYRFNNCSDFQYLSVHKENKNSELKFIHHDVIPAKLMPLSWLTDESDVPYYFVPPAFTRVDTIQTKIFAKEQSKYPTDVLTQKNRTKRSKHTKLFIFDLNSPIPTKPHPTTLDYLKTKVTSPGHYVTVKEMFDKRPIWSRQALLYETKLPDDQLKCILSAVGYYCISGPWRIMWVRLGYDPRKNFESRYYQTFDYRLRNVVSMKADVVAKTSTNRKKPNLVQKPKPTSLIDSNQIASSSADTQKKSIIYYTPYYKYGEIPETRQTYFQYCDLHIPQIQEMLDKIRTPVSGAVCNEKTGWLPTGFDDLCRDIITEGLKEKNHNAVIKTDDDDDERDPDYLSEYDDDEEEEEDNPSDLN